LIKNSLLYGTFILLASNFFIKFLGFFYRVVLVRILGTEGIGLVEMVTPIYAFVLVLTTWGIPLAMSKLVAEETAKGNQGNVQKIFRVTVFLLVFSGLLSTGLVYLFAPLIIKYFAADQRIYFCFLTMVPAIFIIAVCSVFRAYFQGLKQVSAIGVSQALEQTVRVIVGLTLAVQLRKYGLEIAVIAVSLASVLGELAGLIYMITRYKLSVQNKPLKCLPTFSRRQIVKNVFSYGTPVTITRLLSTFLIALQAILIPKGLMLAGCDLRTSTEIYGRFSGVALSLLHLPGIFTMSLAVSMIPAVAELVDGRNKKLLNHRVSEALQISVVFAAPSMMLLFYFGRELCDIIFHAPEAGEPLRILALGGVFLYVQQTLNSIMQGLGKVRVLLANTIISGSCQITGILLFTSIPSWGINGAALALVISYFIGSTLNFLYLKNYSLNLSFTNIYFKPFTAGTISLLLLCFGELYLFSLGENQIILMLSSMVFLTCSYFILLFLMGGMHLSIFSRLPLINRWF
jgi:stage V sporulation protein B